jgi:hypothetical protein
VSSEILINLPAALSQGRECGGGFSLSNREIRKTFAALRREDEIAQPVERKLLG